MQVNNAIYETLGAAWWDEDAGFEFSSLRYCVNPLRFAYFQRVLAGTALPGRSLLDLGCGGGYLAEEFAKAGFKVTGIDPAVASIEAARAHAAANSLAIEYRNGRGEDLPFPGASFDVVACCDVLEHVYDIWAVIHEIARTLKPGGVFLFDTVNRTLASKFVLIKVWQDWELTGTSAPNAHVWDKFIRPDELKTLLSAKGLVIQAMTGIGPKSSPPALAWNLLRLRNGKLRGPAVAGPFAMRETPSLRVSYMGWAIRDDRGTRTPDRYRPECP